MKTPEELVRQTHLMLRHGDPQKLEAFLLAVLAPSLFIEGSDVQSIGQTTRRCGRMWVGRHRRGWAASGSARAEGVGRRTQAGGREPSAGS
jgi:hypothetical protein